MNAHRFLNKITALAAILLISGASSAYAATIDLGDGSGPPGTADITIPLDISYEGDPDVASFNLDVHYDVDKLAYKNIANGESATSAGKQVVASTPAANTIRVILFGLNQTVLEEGTTAYLTFDIKPEAAAGISELTIDNATAADAQAESVPLETLPGTITVEGPANRPPELAAIGNKSIEEGELLEFTVEASDPDDDALTFGAQPLPVGSTFIDEVFSWQPGYGQSGNYTVTFSVSDGE